LKTENQAEQNTGQERRAEGEQDHPRVCCYGDSVWTDAGIVSGIYRQQGAHSGRS
jgi:hypothetical protein